MSDTTSHFIRSFDELKANIGPILEHHLVDEKSIAKIQNLLSHIAIEKSIAYQRMLEAESKVQSLEDELVTLRQKVQQLEEANRKPLPAANTRPDSFDDETDLVLLCFRLVSGELTDSHIMKALNMSRADVNHHLEVLHHERYLRVTQSEFSCFGVESPLPYRLTAIGRNYAEKLKKSFPPTI